MRILRLSVNVAAYPYTVWRARVGVACTLGSVQNQISAAPKQVET